MRQMKPILRIGTALLISCLAAGACSLTAFAENAGNTDTTVQSRLTVVPSDYSEDGKTLTIHVTVNETATDGVLTVTYDPTALSISNDDIDVTELAAMHSANVTQPGELKIGFLAAESQDSGDMAILSFDVLKADAETMLTLTSEVYGENEELITDDITLYAVKNSEKDEDKTPDTGVAAPAALAAAAAISLGGMAACVAAGRRNKHKGGDADE